MKLFKMMWKLLGGVLTVVLALLLAFNLYTIAARCITGNPQPDVLGYSVAVVISGSMSGSIEVNDMVVIHRQNNYAAGDVITFLRGDTLVTHRIVGYAPQGFVTKGDANNTEDQQPVLPGEIVGKVVWVIPKVGAFIEFLQTPLGFGCLALAGAGLLMLPQLTAPCRECCAKEGTDDESQTAEE